MTGSILPPPLAAASQMRRSGSDSDSDSVSLPSSLGHRSLDRRSHRSGTGTGTATPGSASGAVGVTLPRPTSRGPPHGKATPTGPPGGILGWGSATMSRAIPVPIPLPPPHALPDGSMMGSLPLGAGSLPRTSAMGTIGSGKHRWISHNGRPAEGLSRFRGPDLDQEAHDAALNDSQEALESGLQTQLTMMNLGVGGGAGSEDLLLGGPSPMLPLMSLGPMVLHSVHSSQDVQVPVPVCPALCEIRSQLQELTRSVETCQSEVSEMKRDMVAIRHDVETVHQVKEEIEELRECVDRLEEQSRRRKLRLLEQGLTCFLSYAIFAAVLGMLQFGYNTGVINAPQSIIEQFIQEAYYSRYGIIMEEKTAKIVFSIAVAMFAVGGMIGGFIGGFVANRYGRKRGLLLNNIAGVLGACFMGFSKYPNSYEMLILGRLFIGFNCGLNTSLVPMYISEIAPLTLRGGLGTVNQLGVTVGMLISQVLGIEQVLGTKDGWPLLLGLAVVPSLLQLILFSVCPESPRYLLITQNREDEARKALRRLRACSQIEEDVEEMRAEERAQEAEARISMKELILSRNLRKPLVIGIVMQLSQQLSGINAVFYYSTTLFKSAGLTEDAAKYATIGIGAIMVVMTLISIPLMDKAGRRTLHLWGLGGMFIFSIFITISLLVKDLIEWVSYVAVVATLCFVVFFAVGPGSIPWMITAELFSQGPRPAAMSIAVLVNWTANFAVGFGFPSMQVGLENYTFLPFSVLLAVFWVFTYKKVPETRNKTFEEISALFRKSDRNSTNCISSLGSSSGVAMPIPAHENTALLSEDKSLGFTTRDLRKLIQ